MPSARRVSQRRTIVHPFDSRCVGDYQQTGDWPSADSMYASMAAQLPAGWNLRCTGRVGGTTTFDYTRLVEMASLDRRHGYGIALVDFLAEAGLHADAEVLLAHDGSGRAFGVPIRDAVKSDASRLTLGTRRAPLALGGGFPVRMDVPGWTEPSRPVVIHALEALGFSEFVRCR